MVCNSCHNKFFCKNRKEYYDFEQATNKAISRLSAKGNKLGLSNEEIILLDKHVSDRVLAGQSIHAIYSTDSIIQKICSERTIERYIRKGYFKAKSHDLRRFTRFKHKINENNANTKQKVQKYYLDGHGMTSLNIQKTMMFI